MRRDLVYYYDRPLDMVFTAFVQAANQQFGKNCKIDQGKTISFALNYSFKYNMNGGSVTAHFMPHQNGTAIDLHYTIVQAFGARYKRHAADLTGFVDGLLQAKGSIINLPVEQFLSYEERTPSEGPVLVQSSENPYIPKQPVQQPVQPKSGGVPCPRCGVLSDADALFCESCGNPLRRMPEPPPLFCTSCGAKLMGGKFCAKCGARVE